MYDTYIYIYTHTYIHIHTCTHTYTHTYKHTYTHTCIQSYYLYIYMHIHLLIYIHIYNHAYINTLVQTFLCLPSCYESFLTCQRVISETCSQKGFLGTNKFLSAESFKIDEPSPDIENILRKGILKKRIVSLCVRS